MSVRRILKWTVPIDDQFHKIGGGPVVHVAPFGAMFDAVNVWTDENGQAQRRAVRAYGTGQPLPEGDEHLGSVVVADGALVWHILATATQDIA